MLARLGRYSGPSFIATFLAAGVTHSEAEPLHVVKAETSAGYHSPDYSTVGGAAQLFIGETLAATVPTPASFGARLDAMGGHLSGGTLVGGLNAHVYLNREWGLLGLSVARVWLSEGISTTFVGLTGSVYEDDLMTACLNAGYEDHTFGENLWFGEVLLRLYPAPDWLFSPGVSYAQADVKQTRADILLKLEYAAVRSQAFSLGVYAQYGGNLFTKGSAGFTVYFDPIDFRERDRTWGPPSPRFK